MAIPIPVPFSALSTLHLAPGEEIYFDARGEPLNVIVECFPPTLFSPAINNLLVAAGSISRIYTALKDESPGIVLTRIEGNAPGVVPRTIQISKDKYKWIPTLFGAAMTLIVLGLMWGSRTKDGPE